MWHGIASRFVGFSGSIMLMAATVVAGASATAVGCGGGDTATGGGTASSTGGSSSAPGGGGTNANGGSGGTGGTGTGGTAGSGGSGGTGGCELIPIDPNGQAPMKLADTGLYADITTLAISPNVSAYAPAYALWADDAGKGRWAYIPPCEKIDNTDEDHWVFPVGTRFWKEFAIDDGSGTLRRLETRMIEHYGPDPSDWSYVTYQWNDAGTDATLTPIAMELDNVLGTDHDIPAWPGQCLNCHGTNEGTDHVNGFQAIQLSGPATGLNLAALAAKGLLKVAPPMAGFPIPGDEKAKAALGYLHANCGHCHNPDGMQQSNGFRMRVHVGDTDPTMTDTYKTGIGKPATTPVCAIDPNNPSGAHYNRLNIGNPGQTCVHIRMDSRTPGTQMPPVATKVVDTAARDAVDAWMSSLH